MKSQTIKLTGLKQAQYANQLVIKALNEDELWCCEFKKHKEARSLKQNRLIHALFSQISREAANVDSGDTATPAGWKYFFKSEFLENKTEFVGGKFVSVPAKTSKLTKKQCSEFVLNVLNWCVSVGIDIKIPKKDYEFLVMMK